MFGGIDLILEAYQAINPNVDGLLGCLIVFNLPFTLFKGLIDAVLCFLIYKPLSPSCTAGAERTLWEFFRRPLDGSALFCYNGRRYNRIATYQERLREQAL